MELDKVRAALLLMVQVAEQAPVAKQVHVQVEQAYDFILKQLSLPAPQESAKEAPTPKAQA